MTLRTLAIIGTPPAPPPPPVQPSVSPIDPDAVYFTVWDPAPPTLEGPWTWQTIVGPPVPYPPGLIRFSGTPGEPSIGLSLRCLVNTPIPTGVVPSRTFMGPWLGIAVIGATATGVLTVAAAPTGADLLLEQDPGGTFYVSREPAPVGPAIYDYTIDLSWPATADVTVETQPVQYGPACLSEWDWITP